MFFIYNLLINITYLSLHLVGLFNSKISLFVKGRKNWRNTLTQKITASDKVFWVHVASLGEFEQGLPLVEALKVKFPTHKIVLTFFSPSGFEVKKNTTVADVVLYLPMDTLKNARDFITLTHPEKVFFIKYEYWPNYLKVLQQHHINTYLISGVFRPNQVFFKWYGGFYRNAIKTFTHFFVQNESSRNLLHKLNIKAVSVVGDTRFDRVSQLLERDNRLPFLDAFTDSKFFQTIVIGSSWPEDDSIFLDTINQSDSNTKFIIAPHNINSELIQNLIARIKVPVVCHSEAMDKDLKAYQVYIIDTYSLLTKAYSYATLAYVGGGFGSGIHNILEAAVYGIPVLIGPKYSKFQEAVDLIALGGCFVVNDAETFHEKATFFLKNHASRQKSGAISSQFVLKNKNATQKIMTFVFNEKTVN